MADAGGNEAPVGQEAVGRTGRRARQEQVRLRAQGQRVCKSREVPHDEEPIHVSGRTRAQVIAYRNHASIVEGAASAQQCTIAGYVPLLLKTWRWGGIWC